MKLISTILDFIAPIRCVRCDAEGIILCTNCELAELIGLPSSCFYCHRVTAAFETCKKCSKTTHLNAVWTVCDYSALAQSIITRYKYESTRSVGLYIADKMLEMLPDHDFIVTNVPTASNRVRQRGFDHCVMLAKNIAHKRSLMYSPLLLRTNNSHQVGATKTERLRQTKELFITKNTNFIRGQKILLVDDVATTGATLTAAAQTLHKAGAKSVKGLVFARNI